MYNRLLVSMLFIVFCSNYGLTQNIRVFDPGAKAVEDIQTALKLAQQTDKHVLVKVGYNQCSWCVRLHHFLKDDQIIDSTLFADFVLVKVNYSKENRNPEAMELLGYPQRFGFPVLVILDENGNRLHTQNTLYLEKDKSYDKKRIIDFLKSWNRTAIDPDSYKSK